MAELKREAIKMVRDYIKKDYKSRDYCFICGNTETLDLHHLYSLSELFNTWLDKNKIRLDNTVEQITALRVLFAKENEAALSADNLYTLCKKHHVQLHSIYGQRYSNNMAPKIKNWLQIQKDKHGN